MSTLLAAITGLAGIVGAIYGVFKYFAWKAQTTPDQVNQDIDSQTQTDKQNAEDSGRPV